MSNNTGDESTKNKVIDTSNASGIAKLLLVFVWVLLKKTLKIILKCIILLLYKIYKGFKWCIGWWTGDDTRAKRKELYALIKKGALYLFKWICVGGVLIYNAIIWLAKTFISGIIHLRTTAKLTWAAIKKLYRKFKDTDFKAVFQEKKSSMARSINNFVTEKEDEEAKQSEEELLKELEQSKRGNNAFEDTIEKLTRYLS